MPRFSRCNSVLFERPTAAKPRKKRAHPPVSPVAATGAANAVPSVLYSPVTAAGRQHRAQETSAGAQTPSAVGGWPAGSVRSTVAQGRASRDSVPVTNATAVGGGRTDSAAQVKLAPATELGSTPRHDMGVDRSGVRTARRRESAPPPVTSAPAGSSRRRLEAASGVRGRQSAAPTRLQPGVSRPVGRHGAHKRRRLSGQHDGAADA